MKEDRLEFYWSDLPTSRDNALSYDRLSTIWGKDERNIRMILHNLSRWDNGDDYVLIRSSRNRGFYKTDDPDEIEEYKKECLNRGRNVFAPIKKINRVLRSNTSQYMFTNNLRVRREECHLKQTAVCAYMRVYDEAFDVPMLSKMENSVCLPTPYQLSKLAELYKCDPNDLIRTEMFV